MIKRICTLILFALAMVGMITLMGFFNAPGWFIDLACIGEGILFFIAMRRSHRSVGY